MDDFDRDGPFRAEMRGAIDGAHSSFSEELFDLIFVIESVHESKKLQLAPNSYRLFAVSEDEDISTRIITSTWMRRSCILHYCVS